jgi:HAD superfamily hydrolase (TIGR01509 family)
MKFQAVIFDCDGVLVDSERVVPEIEARFLSEAGWPMSPEDARALFKGHTFAQMAAMVEERLADRIPPEWQYGLGFATAQGLQRLLKPVDGVAHVLERVLAAGLPMAVASQSAPARVRLSLEVCRLQFFFGNRVYSASQVARPKPAPDLYLHAAQGLGVAAAACAVVEDSPSGVRAAVAAGMRVFGYAADEDAAALAAAGATVFQAMSELPALLRL